MPGTGRNESLQRAFELLEILAQHKAGATVAELSKLSGLPRSTVSRILASLFDAGAVARPGADRHWLLGPTILRLTNAVSPAFDLQERAARVLKDISEELAETSMIAVPTGQTTARVIDEVKGPKLVGVSSDWEGQTISSGASGYVRLLLAELPEQRCDEAIGSMQLESHTPSTITANSAFRKTIAETRRVGHSIVIDELEDGLAGIGVPVRRNGQLIAMLAIYLPTVRLTLQFQEHALEVLKRGAQELA